MEPGDVILTGTPPGVGMGLKPAPKFLKGGDVVRLGIDGLGACPSNRCSNPSESDSSLDYEQALSPLEYRSDAASAAECAGLRAQGPRLAVYRWAGAGEPGSQGDHGQ